MFKLTLTRFEPDGTITDPIQIGPKVITRLKACRRLEAAENHYKRLGYEIRRSGGGRMAARRPDGGVIVAQMSRA